jgi:hypothetical protein
MTLTPSYDFASDLALRIVQYSSIPKLQVERIVGPILTIFLEEITNRLLSTSIDGPDTIRLIAPEWPIKKDENNQSTNIDWLMVQPGRNRLFFIELKTDSGSEDHGQLKTYQRLVERVRRHSAAYLLIDAERIRDASKDNWKYDHILEFAEPYREQFSRIREAEIVYIVPSRMKKALASEGVCVFGLDDLPQQLTSSKNEVWRTLRPALCALESTRRNAPRANAALTKHSKDTPDCGAFARQIETRLRRPSLVAATACKRQTCNGWTFWKYERAPGDWVPLDNLRK